MVKLVLGVLLVGLSVRNFRKHRAANEEAELPKWLQSIESITPAKAIGLGALLSAVNPKNLLMIASAMVSLSQYHL